ncbi:MAG: LysR family transcriptional regulator [Parvibaculaceae bacterium]
MVRYTLRQCAYFRAVAEHGGIAKAARVLNISQPSVAEALAKLEAVTGLVLFERHHAKGASLTLQGRLFLDHVLALDLKARQVEREAAALAAERAGEIRLGIFHTLAPFYAPGLIRSFAGRVPDIRIHPEEMSLSELADGLREGTLDLALTYDRGADLSGLDTLGLLNLRPHVVLPASHRRARQKTVRLQDLAHEPYVMFDASGSRHYFEELLAENGIDPPIAYRSGSLETVRSAVSNGFGFTLLVMRPPHAATYDGKEVAIIAIRGNVRPLGIVLAAREKTLNGPILRRFADHARRYFRSPSAASDDGKSTG